MRRTPRAEGAAADAAPVPPEPLEPRELASRAGELIALLEEQVTAAARRSAAAGDTASRLEQRLAAMEAERSELLARLASAESQASRLVSLYVAAYQLHTTLDVREVETTIAEIASNLLGARSFVLLLREAAGPRYVVALAQGPASAGGPFARGAYAGGDPMIDGALAAGRPWLEPVAGAVPLAVVPFTVLGATSGALVILELLGHRPALGSEDHELLELVAAHSGSALSAARLYASLDRKARTLQGLVEFARGLSGNLEDVPVVDVLQFVHLGQRSGTLELLQGGRRGTVGFHRGRIVSATCAGTLRLGEQLIAEGVIDEATLEFAVAVQERERPRRSLGQTLVALGSVTPEELHAAFERHVERVVYEMVGWTAGGFRFVPDELRPPDDLAIYPGDIIPQVNLNTQMVLLEAARIFDERSRGPRALADPAQAASDAPTAVVDELAPGDASAPAGDGAASAVAPAAAPPVAAVPAPALHLHTPAAPVRVQVVTPDVGLATALADELGPLAATVTRLTLRDAGVAAPGEAPPLVVVDLRPGGVGLDGVATLRRTRPRAQVVAALAEPGAAIDAYAAGALAVVPPQAEVIAACAYAILSQRPAPADAEGIAEGVRSGIGRLRRVFGELRSDLLSTSLCLNLMNLVADTVERAMLFLARRDDLLALGAFGLDAAGRPLARSTQGLTLPLATAGGLSEALGDGRARCVPFEQADLPMSLAELLGRPRTGQAAIFPMLGARHVIAVVYADNDRSERPLEEVELLELATAQVGIAFENELLRRQLAAGPAAALAHHPQAGARP